MANHSHVSSGPDWNDLNIELIMTTHGSLNPRKPSRDIKCILDEKLKNPAGDFFVLRTDGFWKKTFLGKGTTS